MPRGSSGGTEVAITTCAQSPVTDSVSHRHSASSAISRVPSTTRRLRESSMTTRTLPPVALSVAPPWRRPWCCPWC